MFEKFIIYLTEKKILFKNKKERIFEKLDDASWVLYEKKSDIKSFYNRNLKNIVDKISGYFEDLYDDFFESNEVLYDLVWYCSDGRFFGYIMSVIISFVLLLLIDVIVLLGMPRILLLLSLIPVSLIPIDIITTSIIFISKRFKRLYNRKLNKMKKEYGVISDRDLVEVYRKKNINEETKIVKKEEAKTFKKESTSSEKSTSQKEYMSDSDFIEKLFSFVNNSKYIDPKYREAYLMEVENVINKYSESRKGKTDKDLKTSIEFLQGEYNRYLNNTQNDRENSRSYPVRIMKK